jgi:hypothetical protein
MDICKIIKGLINILAMANANPKTPKPQNPKTPKLRNKIKSIKYYLKSFSVNFRNNQN